MYHVDIEENQIELQKSFSSIKNFIKKNICYEKAIFFKKLTFIGKGTFKSYYGRKRKSENQLFDFVVR
ncbi:hypothetical protein AXA65_07275 [Chryseobacterium sp. FP211-J200]|nr:hypothetical protein AXA65_07275 [Chryseobacterium sp. FP211-J200]